MLRTVVGLALTLAAVVRLGGSGREVEAQGHIDGPHPAAAVADGRPVSVRQVPALLTGDYTGVVEFRDLTFMGDVPVVRVYDGSLAPAIDVPRASTITLAGRTASVFHLAWPMAEFVRLYGWQMTLDGVVGPQVTVAPSTAPLSQVPSASIVFISPRLMTAQPGNVPVAVLDANAQMTSHVINLVVSDVADQFASLGTVDYRRIAQQVYQRLGDDYDMLHVVPEETFFASYAGQHDNARNDVGGIGLGIFDATASYGSAGHLRGLSFFPTAPPSDALSNHEIFHQWGDYIDWTGIAGITAPTASHSPLWTHFETPVASVAGQSFLRLLPAAAVAGAWDAVSVSPTRLHPWQEYALGRRAAVDVGPITLLTNQGVRYSKAGTRVTSGSTAVTIDQIVARHGPRTGPRVDALRVAYVVVSRQALLSPRMMSLFTWLAQDLEDADPAARALKLGSGSFDAVTGVDLSTALVPPAAVVVSPHATLALPNVGVSDVGGLRFDAPLPRRLEPLGTLAITGTLMAWPDAKSIRAAWSSDAGVSSFVSGAILPGQRFSIAVPAPPAAGLYDLRLLVERPSSNVLTMHRSGPFVVGAPVLPGAVALAAATTSRTVALTWTPPATGTPPTSYLLEAGSAPGLANLARARLGAAPAFTAQGVPDGRYYLRVRAGNGAGDGPPSNEVVVDVPSCAGLTAPILSGTGTDGVVALSWTSVTGASGYRLEAGTQSGASNLAVLPVAATSLQAPAPPGTYYLRVRAVNSCGVSSASNELALSVVPPTPPAPPTGLAAQVTGTNVTLSWNASPAATAGYRLDAGSTPGAANLGSLPIGGTSVTAPGVPSGTYYIRVRSVGAAGAGPASAEVQVVVP